MHDLIKVTIDRFGYKTGIAVDVDRCVSMYIPPLFFYIPGTVNILLFNIQRSVS